MLGPWLCMNVAAAQPPLEIRYFGMRSPGPHAHAIEQASDLCWGRLGAREGLWTACDRNGGESGAHIYLFTPATLSAAATRGTLPTGTAAASSTAGTAAAPKAAAIAGGTIAADEEMVIVPPKDGWSAFRNAHRTLPPAVLDDLQQRIEPSPNAPRPQPLDLEALTLAPAVLPPHEPRLFVVAEEPYSLVLELAVGQAAQPTRAELVAAYQYHERENEHGIDLNDGLEGLTSAGPAGRFFWAEEGTRLHKPDAHPRLFFSDPRVGVAELKGCAVEVAAAASDALTQAARGQKDRDQQTLNGLCSTPDGRLLAVDRNGGWILQLDPRARSAARWFNVYDIAGASLRKVLSDFPGPRVMPYVSIEGVALDGTGAVWLVDDPAMPEPFRASCLVRITGLPQPKKP